MRSASLDVNTATTSHKSDLEATPSLKVIPETPPFQVKSHDYVNDHRTSMSTDHLQIPSPRHGSPHGQLDHTTGPSEKGQSAILAALSIGVCVFYFQMIAKVQIFPRIIWS